MIIDEDNQRNLDCDILMNDLISLLLYSFLIFKVANFYLV
mgnify:CR=1 FL=1